MLAARLTQYWRDRGGGAAVVVALSLVPLIAALGLAIDTGRVAMVRARLTQALDAAALAGGRAFYEATRDNDVRAYFRVNFPQGYLDAQLEPLRITADQVAGTLTVEARATVPTTFMSVVGQLSVPVAARSVVRRADRGMELALVMDNTGSMYQNGRSDSRMNRMKAAASQLVDILYGGRETIANFWVGLVPYTASVNIGNSRSAWLVPGAVAALPYTTGLTWKGCVEARDASGHDLTDAPPSVARFPPFFFPTQAVDNPWPPADESVSTNTRSNNGKGPNLGCGPPITPLTASRSAVQAAIASMASWHRGGTITSEGLAWGWRVLSPNWRGQWGGATPATLPLDYGTPLMVKAVVILTDGKNELYSVPARSGADSDYTAYGRVSAGRLGTTRDYTNAARRRVNEKTAALCTAMKRQGIILYTITLEVDDDTAGREGKELFRNCASSPGHYFDNPVGTDLSATFRSIANQLGNLRIAE